MPKKHLTMALGLALTLVALTSLPALAADYESAFQAGSIERLQHEAQAATRKNPKDTEAWAWLARALYKQGKFEQAEAALEHAGTSTVDGLLAHADYAWYTGQDRQAIRFYQEVLKKDAGNVSAGIGLSSTYLHTDQYDKAYDLASELEAKAEKAGSFEHSRVLVVLGGAQGLKANRGSLMEKIRFGPKVKGTLERAVSLDPHSSTAQQALGRFYLQAPGVIGGNPSRSLAYLEKGVELDPYNYLNDAWYIRGLVENHRTDKAKQELVDYKRKFASVAAAREEISDIKL